MAAFCWQRFVASETSTADKVSEVTALGEFVLVEDGR
jgi:hypothetical protein